MSILDYFSVLLLDMNSTFMFEEDRFGQDQDYAETYKHLDGKLPATEVQRLIQSCYDRIYELYLDPKFHDRFPNVAETLQSLQGGRSLGKSELERLEKTFAIHELGRVPAEYSAAIETLATTHRLGLVADIWSSKQLWLEELQRAGILKLFEAVVFSSDIGSVKPSPRPFLTAMAQMDVEPNNCLMIGDSVRRDIGGAKSAGLASVWVGQGTPPKDASCSIESLLCLAR